ncbi:Alkaline ceramidase 3, partial [Cladochytrium tenue]
NYVVTRYLAEFWNAISNGWFILLALGGLATVHRLQLGWRAAVSFMWIAAVGLGSFAFHATLKFESQMMDELPMIYGTCFFTFFITQTFGDRHKIATAIFLFLYGVAVTAVYLYNRNPVFHEVAYGLLVASNVFLPPLQIRHVRAGLGFGAARAAAVGDGKKRIKGVRLGRAAAPPNPPPTDGLWRLYFWSLSTYLLG